MYDFHSESYKCTVCYQNLDLNSPLIHCTDGAISILTFPIFSQIKLVCYQNLDLKLPLIHCTYGAISILTFPVFLFFHIKLVKIDQTHRPPCCLHCDLIP